MTKSAEQVPFWDVRSSARQEIPHLSWNTKLLTVFTRASTSWFPETDAASPHPPHILFV